MRLVANSVYAVRIDRCMGHSRIRSDSSATSAIPLSRGRWVVAGFQAGSGCSRSFVSTLTRYTENCNQNMSPKNAPSTPPCDSNPQTSMLDRLRPLNPYLKRYWKNLAWGGVAVIFYNVIAVLLPQVAGNAIDDMRHGVTEQKIVFHSLR